MSEPPKLSRIDHMLWNAVSTRWSYVQLLIWCVIGPMIVGNYFQFGTLLSVAGGIIGGAAATALRQSRRRWLAMRAWLLGDLARSSRVRANEFIPPRPFKVKPSPDMRRRN